MVPINNVSILFIQHRIYIKHIRELLKFKHFWGIPFLIVSVYSEIFQLKLNS